MPDYYKCEIKSTTKAKPKPKLELMKTTMMFYFVCIILFFTIGFGLFYIINKQPKATNNKNDMNYTILITVTTVIAIISALIILIFQYIIPLHNTINKKRFRQI